MDNRRLLLAALLSLGVLIFWQVLIPAREDGRPDPFGEAEDPAYPQADLGESPAGGVPVEGSRFSDVDAPGDEEATAPPLEDLEASLEEQVAIETARHLIRLTNRGAQIVSFRLKERLDQNGEPLELVKSRAQGPFPMAIVGLDGSSLPITEALHVVERSRDSEGNPTVSFRYRGANGAAEKHFRFDHDQLFHVELEVHGVDEWGVFAGPGLRDRLPGEMDDRYQHRAFSYLLGGEHEESDASSQKETLVVPGESLRWIALDDSYFLTALVLESPVRQAVVRPLLMQPPSIEGENPTFLDRPAELTDEQEDLPQTLAVVLQPAGNHLSAIAYWGAKEYDTLIELPYGLEETVHWYLGVLARPLLSGLRWIHANVVQNYGWSIVLMTFLIKLVLFPLTHKSYVSMQRMQKLSPKMEAIRQKYRPKLKDKRGRPNLEMQRKMNEETQKLFKTEGVNPAGGCFPMLLQLPVFIAFYNVLRNAVELWNAPWMFWIQDLSVKDPIYILPLVMGATQLLQQRMTPMTTMQPSQRMIMTTMPIWFTVISFGFPSGLVLYWLTNNVLTIVQQGGYNRLKKAGWLGGDEKRTDAKPTHPSKIENPSRKVQ